MTKLEKLELEVAKLRATVAELQVQVNESSRPKSVMDLFGIYANDPEMQKALEEDRLRRQRERDRELAAFDRRELRNKAKAKSPRRRAKVA